MNEFERPPDLDKPGAGPQAERDHPEQYPTDQKSLFDTFLSERNVDAIPVEDLGIENRDEANKSDSKDDSSSERKLRE
ncbi:hypothetical protein SAMN05216312_103477 [Cohnella sp. OV330]|uniref:hypothetical protein n=1 Tax=Cohnella sp. OV330 TaxID=1855288 RepID=UPI0008E39D86|nr:hypothetical protein [Cohnella sp. OV330]SFB09563.1 hypothetical protein SAMN05216312_103477 [Cohnella sp. OV330]